MSVVVHSGKRRALMEAVVAALLGIGFLAFVAWQQLRVMDNLSADWPALIESLQLRLGETPLGDAVYQFVGMQLLLHAAFGLLCWGLARCTAIAFPGLGRRPYLLLAAWFAIGVSWVLIANATEYPWSKSGIYSEVFGVAVVGRFRLLDLLTFLVLACVLWVIARTLLAYPAIRRQLPRAALFGTLLVVCVVAWRSLQLIRIPEVAAETGKPNIILIGIDSLRGDALGGRNGLGLTPHIDKFIRDGGHQFTDAITPLARTFPSWTSILSGKYPTSTGARENLLSFSQLRQFDTVAEIARRAGYHTIYATDEVRFSNIDATYGFDQVITPPIGAADFLLGKANDLPLPNLVSNSWLGKWMFPYTYGNRAAAYAYRPETFVEWVSSEIEPDRSTLLAIHLALPHNPYNWAEPDNRIFDLVADRSYQYANAVIKADTQFGSVLAMLERKGLLGNAIVVLLSDHGEALGNPDTDSMLRGEVARQMLDAERISFWGHGTSVLSWHQFAAVLAIRGYGASELGQSAHLHDEPVSLVDIAPTLIDLAGLEARDPFDGWSLRPLIEGDAAAPTRFMTRPRFTETGFRTRLIMLGDFDERSVLGEAASFFVMNPSTGRFEVRRELMNRLISDKERAALTSKWMLASIPAVDRQSLQKYVLVGLQGQSPQRLTAPPAADADPEIRALWQALADHYGSEMRPPAPRAELPPVGLASNSR